jgi:hypothetical protein
MHVEVDSINVFKEDPPHNPKVTLFYKMETMFAKYTRKYI